MSPQKAMDNGENKNYDDEARARLEQICARIENACEKAGRAAKGVLLIGASKTISADELPSFLQAGLSNCGENYVQEGVGKSRELRAGFPDVKWHLIGALQSNKAREAVAHFHLIHSVDRASLIHALDKASREQNKIQEILLQVNLGDESSKAGCAVGDLDALVSLCKEKENLNLRGLMCLPPFDENPESRRPYFQQLRRLRDSLGEGSTWELSMGMSHDFEIAIEEGATMIRVGTSLFGAREKKI